jgi:lysophospholipase L1-like esterase
MPQKHVSANKPVVTQSTHTFSYLALGDSYTIGEAVPQAESFPYQLAAQLNAQGCKIAEPYIIAVTGWTTDNLIGAIQQSDILNKHFDIVTLLIGVNDQYQGLSREHYKTNFKQLLQTAIGFANGNTDRVFVLSIPDYGVTPFAQGHGSIIGPHIDQFNAINKEISEAAGVYYVDVTPISRKAATEPDLIASDGLHPSGKMYGLWVQQLSAEVEKAKH